MKLNELIAVARGDRPADLLIKNARIINTFNRDIFKSDIAIYQDTIAGIGEYQRGKEVIDVKGDYIAPGLIDSHTHIESSLLHPASYAAAVVPRGVTTIVTDLHEITNVCGMAGIDFMIKWAEKLPLDMYFMAPSCVPATKLESAGARINAKNIKKLLKHPRFIGLGEMMNFPGVIHGDKNVIKKIEAARGKLIDGHAPFVLGKELNAYMAPGIRSDHECTGVDEAREKLARGMYIMIREGSSAKNLEGLLPLINEKTYRRCLFIVDDRNCYDLLYDGDIDAVVRKSIRLGLDPIMAIQMVTINPAEYFRLHHYGGIGPGYIANLISISNLEEFEVNLVFHHGRLVARRRELLTKTPQIGTELTGRVNIKPFDIERLRLISKKDGLPVIEIVPGQIITRRATVEVKKINNVVQYDIERDIIKVIVVERHHATGNIGIGLVRGFGLKRGAIASSIAHDSHNIVAVGTSDADLHFAVNTLREIGGGLVVCADKQVMASLPLPVAGLLSSEELQKVAYQHHQLEIEANKLGNLPPSPFVLLSFLALSVIPEIKITDKGLVDVSKGKFIGI